MKTFALALLGSQRVDAFYIRPDRSMAHIFNGHGEIWEGDNPLGVEDLLGGVFRSAPTVVYSVRPLPRPTVTAQTGVELERVAQAALIGAKAGPAAAEQIAAQPEVASVAGVAVGVRPTAPCVDVFGLGTDYALYHQAVWNGTPDPKATWENLGGVFISTPATIAWDNPESRFVSGRRIDVFGLGTDRAMYQRHLSDGEWSDGWERLGGTFSSEASVVSWGPNRLDLFARGYDFTLRHRSFDGTSWNPDWQNVGGDNVSMATPPTSVTWGENRLDVFWVNNSGLLAHTWWDGMIWNDQETLGAPASGVTYVDTPSVVAGGTDRLDVFTQGSDGNIYQTTWDTQWHPAINLGGDSYSTPSAVRTDADTILLAKHFPESKEFYVASVTGTSTPNWQQTPFVGVQQCQYSFELESYKCITTRAQLDDTDTALLSVTPGNWPAQTNILSMGDVGLTSGGTSIARSTGPVLVETSEFVLFGYQIMNSKDGAVPAWLVAGSSSLASETQTVIKSLIGQGVGEITKLAIGGISSVPVIGTILGMLSGWLVSQVEGIVLPDCDGFVALEQVVIQGDQLQRNTAAGPWRTTTTHPGTTSPDGCFGTSLYEVTWTITQI